MRGEQIRIIKIELPYISKIPCSFSEQNGLACLWQGSHFRRLQEASILMSQNITDFVALKI